jgi:hypothetical protein
MIVGLRRNIDYNDAVQLVDKGDFLLGGLAYPATKIVRSPLFQRMANGIEDAHTQQTMNNLDETQRVATMQKISVEAGVSKQDLQELMNHISRMSQGGQGGGQGGGGGGSDDQDMPPPPGRDVAKEAQDNVLRAQMQSLLEEQRKMDRHKEMADELRQKLEAQNSKDTRQEIIREIHQHHVHPIAVPVPQTPPDPRPLIGFVASQLAAQNNNIHEVAKNLNMSQAEILNVLENNVQNTVNNYNFTPTLINHNNVFQNLTQNLTQNYSIATPAGDRSRSREPIESGMPMIEDIPQRAKEEVIPVMSSARGRSRSRTAVDEPTPQLRRAIKDKSMDVEVEVIPQLQKKKTRPRSQALEEETPQLRKAIKDRPRAESAEIIPQSKGSTRSRSLAMEQEETPQLTVVQRAIQLFQKEKQTKGSEMEQIVPHLGNALMRAKAKLLTKRSAERRASVAPSRSISDIITEVESKGLPTDLSPRLRKPMKLQMEAFQSRPQVTSFGPTRRTRRISQNFV